MPTLCKTRIRFCVNGQDTNIRFDMPDRTGVGVGEQIARKQRNTFSFSAERKQSKRWWNFTRYKIKKSKHDKNAKELQSQEASGSESHPQPHSPRPSPGFIHNMPNTSHSTGGNKIPTQPDTTTILHFWDRDRDCRRRRHRHAHHFSLSLSFCLFLFFFFSLSHFACFVSMANLEFLPVGIYPHPG